MNTDGPTSSPSVELDADMAAGEGFHEVLENLLAAIRSNWQGTLDDEDTEYLHQLRIALRRTRTVLGHGKGILPKEMRSTFRGEFAWLAGLTGPTRDLDAFILEWDRYIADFSTETITALQSVRDHLHSLRTDTFTAMRAALCSKRAEAVVADWSTALDDWRTALDDWRAPESDGAKADKRLGHIVADLLHETHRTVIENGRRIGPDSPAEELHELRKDAKKLRYIVECFGAVLPTKLRKDFVRQLKGLQDNLGEHQDAAVHVDELRLVSDTMQHERTNPATLIALGELIERLDAGQRSARAEFAERFAEYDSEGTRHVFRALLDEIDER